LKTCSSCQRSGKLAELTSYIKGAAKQELKKKGASALLLVNPAVSGPRFGKVERQVKLEELASRLKASSLVLMAAS
jgi:hypothetical protein